MSSPIINCRLTPAREKKLNNIDISFTELVDWALDNYGGLRKGEDINYLLTLGRAVVRTRKSDRNNLLCELLAEGALEVLFND